MPVENVYDPGDWNTWNLFHRKDVRSTKETEHGAPPGLQFDPLTGRFYRPNPGGGGGGGGGGAPFPGSTGYGATHPTTLSGVTQTGTSLGATTANTGVTMAGTGTGFWGNAARWAGDNWQPLANAALGAYGSYSEAKRANEPRSSTVDVTNTQLPWDITHPHFERILSEAGNLYSRGPQRAGGGGNAAAQVAELDPSSSGFSTDARSIYNEAAQRGFDMRENEAARLATGGMRDILTGGGETGFEGYNPVLASLVGRLGGVGMDETREVLMGFRGAPARGGGGGSGAGGRGGVGGGGGSGSFRSFSSGGGGGGGRPPDTGAGDGTFQRELNRIFSEEANEEEIAAVLESMQGDIERQSYRAMADLEARAAGSGRFGGDWHAARIGDAKARTAEEIGQIAAQLRYGDLESRRNARLAALNILNSRDVAAMNDQTQRAGIAASSASSAANRALQERLGLRGQDLEAISLLLNQDLAGLQLLSGAGGQLSSDRLTAMGMAPAIAGIELGGLGTALGAGQGLGELFNTEQGVLAGQQALQFQAADNAAARNASASRFNAGAAQRQLDNYLRTVLGVASTGGTTSRVGMETAPGAGYNTGAAAAMGALGGWNVGRGSQRGEFS